MPHHDPVRTLGKIVESFLDYVRFSQMSAARLISLPLFVLDLLTLAQGLASEPGHRLALVATPVSAKFFVRREAISGVRLSTSAQADLLAENVSAQDFRSQESDSKSQSEEIKRVATENKSNTPARPSQTRATIGAPAKPLVAESPEQNPIAKPPSILQMLDGHELELLVAAAIALVFFLIGWICGGNYYLRRDRRRRTKLRF